MGGRVRETEDVRGEREKLIEISACCCHELGFGALFTNSEDATDREQNEREGHGDLEGRFGPGGRERFEERHLLERLGDEHEEVKEERQRGAYDESAAPVAFAARSVGNGQNNQGDDAEDNSRSDSMEGKEEAGDASGHGGEEKYCGELLERFPGYPSI